MLVEVKQLPVGPYVRAVERALLEKRDTWGEAVLRTPGGPSYKAVRRHLKPLLLVGHLTDSGVYYLAFGRPVGPVALHVADGGEILSRRAITYALEKAGLKSVSVEESQTALNLATETSFDLIFLDVQMPGMDGFDLCAKIRALPTNKNTPVIFVTSLADFKSRARSSLSGGADLIAKPFMFIELSVKALAYTFRGQLLKAKK